MGLRPDEWFHSKRTEMLSRFERGRCAEFGSRKLLAVLAVLGLELGFAKTGVSGSLEDLRRERGGEA